jgi:hypothetical protein
MAGLLLHQGTPVSEFKLTLQLLMKIAEGGKCTCLTKTPDPKFHKNWCTYKRTVEAAERTPA